MSIVLLFTEEEERELIQKNPFCVQSLQESHKTPRRFPSWICGLGEVILVAVNHDAFVEVTKVHGKRVEDVIFELRLRVPCTKYHVWGRKELTLCRDETRGEFPGLCQRNLLHLEDSDCAGTDVERSSEQVFLLKI